MPLRIGLVADTHGLARPEALAALAGADVLLHAGDIGGAPVLAAFAAFAPVHAVRGNNDRDPWGAALPALLHLRFEGVDVLLVHDVAELIPADLPRSGPFVVVAGHSHRPGVIRRDGGWWVNPGSAGPRRFRLPVSVGWLRIDGDAVDVSLVDLPVRPVPAG
jgi:hypothetical protein